MSLLKKFVNSRKFWATVVGFITVLSTALEDGTLSQGEVNALAGIIIGYVFSVAFEDGMTNRVNWNSVAPTSPPLTIETVQSVPETGTTVETVVSEAVGDDNLKVSAQRSYATNPTTGRIQRIEES